MQWVKICINLQTVKMAQCLFFYALFILHNCHPVLSYVSAKPPHSVPFIPTENKVRLKLEVFYSPTDKSSFRFIREMLFEVATSEVGFYLILKMYPVVTCELVMEGNVGEKIVPINKTLSCKPGKEEEILAIEHLCAFETLSQGPRVQNPIVEQVIDKVRMVDGINYILCTYKHQLEEVDKRIARCRGYMEGNRGNNIKKCVEKNSKSIVEKAIKQLKMFDPAYFPFLVVNNNQSKKQDQEAFANLGKMLCKKLKTKPPRCNKPFELQLEDIGFPDMPKVNVITSTESSLPQTSGTIIYFLRSSFFVIVLIIMLF